MPNHTDGPGGIIDVSAATHRIVDVLKVLAPRPDEALIALAFAASRLCVAYDIDPYGFVEQFWLLHEVESQRHEREPS